MKPLVTKIIWFYYGFTDEKILKQQQQQQQQQRQNLLNKTKQEQIKMRVFRNFSKYLK